jgi:hypothetical protein
MQELNLWLEMFFAKVAQLSNYDRSSASSLDFCWPLPLLLDRDFFSSEESSLSGRLDIIKGPTPTHNDTLEAGDGNPSSHDSSSIITRGGSLELSTTEAAAQVPSPSH